jgi:hypothetical protein
VATGFQTFLVRRIPGGVPSIFSTWTSGCRDSVWPQDTKFWGIFCESAMELGVVTSGIDSQSYNNVGKERWVRDWQAFLPLNTPTQPLGLAGATFTGASLQLSGAHFPMLQLPSQCPPCCTYCQGAQEFHSLNRRWCSHRAQLLAGLQSVL